MISPALVVDERAAPDDTGALGALRQGGNRDTRRIPCLGDADDSLQYRLSGRSLRRACELQKTLHAENCSDDRQQPSGCLGFTEVCAFIETPR
jgi:hypothetical protein